MSVYFAAVRDYIKIGFSLDPIARSTTITRLGDRPGDVFPRDKADLIGWIPGDVWVERSYHVKHLPQRVAGEWFQLDRDVAERHIWDDPRGVSLKKMSALAVFACLKYPEMTRDQIAAAGIQIAASAEPFELGFLGGAA